MRFLLLTFLSVLVSCGQSTSSKGGGSSKERQNEEYVTNIREVDLLDVSMDVPVEISGNKITFKQTIADSANGIRSTCELTVNTGDSYDYSVAGSSLIIKTSSGQKMKFNRVSGEGDSILGSWSGKTRTGGQLIMRRMTFVSENRLIMRTHCES